LVVVTNILILVSCVGIVPQPFGFGGIYPSLLFFFLYYLPYFVCLGDQPDLVVQIIEFVELVKVEQS
jgi:hypothetical protein